VVTSYPRAQKLHALRANLSTSEPNQMPKVPFSQHPFPVVDFVFLLSHFCCCLVGGTQGKVYLRGHAALGIPHHEAKNLGGCKGKLIALCTHTPACTHMAH